jgi:hypothetical protein
MLETVMLIAVGFFSACLLALLMVPALWRRAVRLTETRMRSQTPLSVADIQADKDRLRAEYALEIRRLEKSLESMRERLMASEDEARHKGEVANSRSGEAISATRNLAEISHENQELHEKLSRAETEARAHLQSLRTANERLTEQGREMHSLRSLAQEAGNRANEQTVEIAALKTVIATDQERRRNAEDAIQRMAREPGSATPLGSVSTAARETVMAGAAAATAGNGAGNAATGNGSGEPAPSGEEARLATELDLARADLSKRIHEVETLKARIGELVSESDHLRKRLRANEQEHAGANRSAVAVGEKLEALRRDLANTNLRRRRNAAEMRQRVSDIAALALESATGDSDTKAFREMLKQLPPDDALPAKKHFWNRTRPPALTLGERLRDLHEKGPQAG